MLSGWRLAAPIFPSLDQAPDPVLLIVAGMDCGPLVENGEPHCLLGLH